MLKLRFNLFIIKKSKENNVKPQNKNNNSFPKISITITFRGSCCQIVKNKFNYKSFEI